MSAVRRHGPSSQEAIRRLAGLINGLVMVRRGNAACTDRDIHGGAAARPFDGKALAALSYGYVEIQVQCHDETWLQCRRTDWAAPFYVDERPAVAAWTDYTKFALRVRLYMVRDVLQVEFDPEPVVIDGLHAGHHRGVHREALGHLERPLTGHVVAHPAHVLDSDLSAASQPAGLAGDDRLTLAEQ